MKRILQLALAGIVAMSSASLGGQPVSQSATIRTLEMKQIDVVEIDTSHVKLRVGITVVPAQSATLENLQLCSLRLNDQPVFAEPLTEEIVLRKDVPIDLPPMYVTVLFRDITTVKPLRRMLDEQSVHLQGELVADLRLNFLEKLALHTQHPRVQIALDREVPAEFGGGPFARSAASAMLMVADTGLQARARTGNYLPDGQGAWIRDLKAQAKANLYDVRSSYSVQQKGDSYPVVLDQLGFRIGSGSILTTTEAEAPWKYDADFLASLKSGAAKIAPNGQEIELRQIGRDANALKLSRGEFEIKGLGKPEEEQVTSAREGHAQVKVLRRGSPASLAVLTTHAALPGTGFTVAPAAVLAQSGWEQVAVFRLRMDTETGEPSIEALQLAASREGDTIRLAEPVDSAVFGSPIVTQDGVIGLVQDERTGTTLPREIAARHGQR